MKLILFGGAETDLGQVVPEILLIGETIKRLSPKQVLHIPFARTVAHEKEWEGDWFNRHIDLGQIRYLNAEKDEDVEQAEDPLIFISGGSQSARLVDEIKKRPRLLDMVQNADCIVGESAGSKILGKFFSVGWENENDNQIIEGLNLVKNTVIEVHYRERNRKARLEGMMRKTGAKIGLGIDAMTAIEFDSATFPEKYTKIGNGNIEITK